MRISDILPGWMQLFAALKKPWHHWGHDRWRGWVLPAQRWDAFIWMNIHLSFDVPSGNLKIAIEHGTFIVDLPIKDGDFP